MGHWSLRQYRLDCTRDAVEGDAAIEEGGDGDLVCGVERDAVRAAGLCSFVGETQTGELAEVGLGEVELTERLHIKG